MGAAALAFIGCAASPGSATFAVEAGRYESAFDAAKDRLRGAGFDLARIDAREGSITTEPMFSAGLATPWIGVESTFTQEVSSLLNRQRRRARVVFEPVHKPGNGDDVQHDDGRDARPTNDDGRDARPTNDNLMEDLRAYDGPMRGRVTVTIERLHRPGLQLQPDAIRLSQTALDPSLVERGMFPVYAEQVGQDDRLAGRLARGIRKRAGFDPASTDNTVDQPGEEPEAATEAKRSGGNAESETSAIAGPPVRKPNQMAHTAPEPER